MNQIQTRLQDAMLGSAIDNAIKKLPQDYTINIVLEAGSVGVVLYDLRGNECDFDTAGVNAYEYINDAVKFAEASQ